jgi:outer membrane murein-binding lipoprotein Lpp
MPAAMTPSVAAVAGENKSNEGTKKKKKISTDTYNLGRYSRKEMTILVDQVLRIEPEYMKNGWKVVAAAVDREMKANNPRSPTALRKKYEEIAQTNSNHPDLGPLVKKILDREVDDIKKKNILTSVQGCPGNMCNLMGGGSDEKEKNRDGNENESNKETMLHRMKSTQRLKAIEGNREEQENKKKALSTLVAQSAAALATAASSSGQGMNENVVQLTIDQKHLKRKVDQIDNNVSDLNASVQEMKRDFGAGFTRIEELINKKMRHN